MSRRSREIRRLVVEEGRTEYEVAAQFGVTQGRVSAIIRKMDGGVSEARRRYKNNHRHRPEVEKEG